jgi:hypothetical protein
LIEWSTEASGIDSCRRTGWVDDAEAEMDRDWDWGFKRGGDVPLLGDSTEYVGRKEEGSKRAKLALQCAHPLREY